MNLVVLAAGMGSRFGGLKQIQSVDRLGNFIIDYSVFDAVKSGCNKVIFVIKKENLDEFRNTIGKRIENFVKVEYAFQEMQSFVPEKYGEIKRKKPWGTGHALLCARDYIDDDFVLINADDFYGKDAFKQIFDFLSGDKNQRDLAMVAYKVKNTITEFGAVKRGLCKIEDGKFLGIAESEIKQKNDKLWATELGTKNTVEIAPDSLVSMNFFGLRKNIFEFLKGQYLDFLAKNKNDLSSCEFYIPVVVSEYIKCGLGDLKVLETTSKWLGLTYKEDYDLVAKGIAKLEKTGDYKLPLWKNN